MTSPIPHRRALLLADAISAPALIAAAQATPGLEPIGVILLAGDAPGTPLGAPALGGAANLTPAIEANGPIDVAIISVSAIHASLEAQATETLSAHGVAVTRLAPLHEAAAINREPIAPRSVEIDVRALLGRDSQPIDEHRVRALIHGKRVLITGAGGSIGSELARRAAAFEPEALILMDRSDNALFDIDRQLGARHPHVHRRAVLHDVTDAEGALGRFVEARPQVVFHAAAHKHVPLMEDHPALAISNNLFGARAAADAALAAGAERFVLISTDKAVNPSSVMGATKRLAELYVRSLNGRGSTEFCLVRFGNVLGSACSVLPIWREQLLHGGPVTVTDARMTRYFMSIPEAAALVMQAASLTSEEAGPSEVFVLDMGAPVRILELAVRFVRAHGMTPVAGGGVRAKELGALIESAEARGRPIEIAITGARPGEKLHEQLVHSDAQLRRTPVPGVLAWSGAPAEVVDIWAMVAALSEARRWTDSDRVVDALREWTPQLPPRTPKDRTKTAQDMSAIARSA